MPSLVDPVLPAGSLSALRQPVLEIGDHRTLRPWRDGDIPVVRAAFDCPDIQRWHTRRIDSDGEALAWITRWDRGWQEETEVNWAIADDDKAIGQVGLRGISLASSVAELAYWLLPEARGAGVMAKAVEVMTRWCFDTVGFHRLFLKHSTANMASCRVATTAGFVHEGTFRASMLHVDGWHDAHFHARLNEGNDHGAA
ncbi:GNAT family N-acetyltransferase [Kibdelosporangium persicum]|uniref:Ribosomal-protein-alanine N-acetyltransferase n=1 Tax=Kibdelosporangium persicum TaxID=2698649 RepID=A0ABX2EWM7_9PSEU|nr:GNAT family N-acetyltransferase [Kibdelosporangium persicum]NRN63103.1 Ribosomal-protein-alanine N-acetyltransferase [Kibdelosporangium persicum]